MYVPVCVSVSVFVFNSTSVSIARQFPFQFPGLLPGLLVACLLTCSLACSCLASWQKASIKAMGKCNNAIAKERPGNSPGLVPRACEIILFLWPFPSTLCLMPYPLCLMLYALCLMLMASRARGRSRGPGRQERYPWRKAWGDFRPLERSQERFF